MKESRLIQKHNESKNVPKEGASISPPSSGISFVDQAIQKKENNTGLPDQLKSGVESLSGIDMSDVKVHYNSSQPAQLNAHAYAQGSQIHIAPGQEKHLPHEAWHVVQQKQGRVKPTMQLKGKVNINDDVGLEKEADVMGARAIVPFQRKKNIDYQYSITANGVAQLKRVDVAVLGITHIVELNSEGSLYQHNFMENEVAETHPGDSVVIEDSVKVRSRRGPNQEQDPTRDAHAGQANVWTNALTHNDAPLPNRSFIRDGTFANRIHPKLVSNLASGTDHDTLMSNYAFDQHVINIDSGHMAVADVICQKLNESLGSVIAGLIITRETFTNYPKAQNTPELRKAWLENQLREVKSASGLLKSLLHSYPGFNGIKEFLNIMPQEISQAVVRKLSDLKNFQHGDLNTAAEKLKGHLDVVHMVNAFGFDPIMDPVQVQHLANMLKAGGRLVITAELTGPTVNPLFKDIKGDKTLGSLLAHLHSIFARTQLSQYFIIGPLAYPNSVPMGFGLRSAVMPQNLFTRGLTTRHTMPSAGATQMENKETVQVTFIRNSTPVRAYASGSAAAAASAASTDK